MSTDHMLQLSAMTKYHVTFTTSWLAEGAVAIILWIQHKDTVAVIMMWRLNGFRDTLVEEEWLMPLSHLSDNDCSRWCHTYQMNVVDCLCRISIISVKARSIRRVWYFLSIHKHNSFVVHSCLLTYMLNTCTNKTVGFNQHFHWVFANWQLGFTNFDSLLFTVLWT